MKPIQHNCEEGNEERNVKGTEVGLGKSKHVKWRLREHVRKSVTLFKFESIGFTFCNPTPCEALYALVSVLLLFN